MTFDPLSTVNAAPRLLPISEPSWLGRNWKWAVPVGCLGIIAVIAAFSFGFLVLIFGALRSSEAVQAGVTRAEGNPEVVRRIGKPIKVGWFVTGSVHTTGPSGEANLKVPIEGPNGKGALYIIGTSKADRWTFTTLEIQIEGASDRIDLLEHSAPTGDQTQSD
jgi:hypothetical protein